MAPPPAVLAGRSVDDCPGVQSEPNLSHQRHQQLVHSHLERHRRFHVLTSVQVRGTLTFCKRENFVRYTKDTKYLIYLYLFITKFCVLALDLSAFLIVPDADTALVLLRSILLATMIMGLSTSILSLRRDTSRRINRNDASSDIEYIMMKASTNTVCR